jgi:hypothetical protein
MLSQGLRSHFLKDGYTVEEDSECWDSPKPAAVTDPLILSNGIALVPTKKFSVFSIAP